MIEHSRVIMHADMDAFYASVEQRDHPELRGRPLAVGGASARGVVAAASYEARRFGVRSAMPSVEAKRRCPQLTFVRGNMALYKKESAQLFQIFREFSPIVERVSLDEAFLDLTGSARLMGPAKQVGQQLRQQVHQQMSLPISVGIAPIKMVAKIASAAAKPDGLLEVTASEVQRFLEPLPVGRIWGVGPIAQEHLEELGFHTIGDVARATTDDLRHALGDWGVEIAQLARGQDIREVEAYREAVSYSEEHTFAQDITEKHELEPLVREHAESVARRLRHDGVRAHTVVLKWKSAQRRAPGARGYPVFTRRTTLAQPTDDGRTIAEHATHLLYRSGPDGAIRLLGVGCTGLTSESVDQLPLFDASADARRSTLNRTVDQITQRFGKKAIGALARKNRDQIGLSMQIKRGDEPDG
jgi:DNA polymerase-4